MSLRSLITSIFTLLLLCFTGTLAWRADAQMTTKNNPKDGAEMVLIPAGEFMMGSKEGEGKDEEHPQHKVQLDAYYIYKNEVTVAQYRKFCADTGYTMPPEPAWKWQDNQPIVNVSWDDAKSYASWAGATLPTEAQWEKAARGIDGRIYPWGNTWDSSKARSSVKTFNDAGQPAAVGSYPAGASLYGCLDMVGNVWEWCDDMYASDYYLNSPALNPSGPTKGSTRVLRGGSWGDYNPDNFRNAFRPSREPSSKLNDCGFRCVPLPAPKKNLKDGSEMVWVPGGTFTMGSAEGVGKKREHPAHQVTLSGYWIYKYDVTVAQYRAFCAATEHKLPPFPQPKVDHPDICDSNLSWEEKTGWNAPALQQHPIVNVTWFDAKAYADWAGVALPTEAQWEYAARGPQGRNYPWGGKATTDKWNNGWDSTKCANYENSFKVDKSTWPVGRFPADTSWCGTQDMAGNICQWCGDWYGAYAAPPVTNPTGPVTGKERIFRGGSWGTGIGDKDDRSADRNGDDPNLNDSMVGFRCATLSPEP
ncbi:MAG: SUMF1/EgtB/PvdO family nonheme iron enzyme [bacterium]